jgi:hypothetical protein
VCNLFRAIGPLRGRHRTRDTDRRRAQDSTGELRALVDQDSPDVDTAVLIVDNQNTHGTACLCDRFELERWSTPEHGRRADTANCDPSAPARQCLSRRSLDRPALLQEAPAWELRRFADRVSIDRQFTAAGARTKLKRLYSVPKLHDATANMTTALSCWPLPGPHSSLPLYFQSAKWWTICLEVGAM